MPLVKAYGSDQGFRVCELAIQTYGGAGFTRVTDGAVTSTFFQRDGRFFVNTDGPDGTPLPAK